MAPPKRKAPKGKATGKKNGRRQAGLASRSAVAFGTMGIRGAGALGIVSLRGAGMLGGVIGRYPSITGGSIAFAVVFSFVAANALWYQPHFHPSPLFRTRDPASPYAIAGRKPFFARDNSDVTTFRIERPDDAATTPAANPTTATPTTVAGAIAAAAAPDAASNPSPSQPNLISQIQTELAHKGLYQGAPDGVMGPRTASAISSYQQSAGMKQTGEATPELLSSLQTSGIKPSSPAIPAERPADIKSKAAEVDPVAAAIMSADKPIRTATVAPRKPAPSDAIANVNMVMQIQKGLANIAYSDVTIDGVVSEPTRQAVLHFQKHYRLPETGVPDMTVLKKLRDIGAL